MARLPRLDWLPAPDEFRAALKTLRTSQPASAWTQAVALANHDLDFVQTNALSHALAELWPDGAAVNGAVKTIRLAVLGSSTVNHLHPGLRVAGLRRNFRIVTYECAYGQCEQELVDPDSALHHFAPDAVLFALDAHHLTAGLRAGLTVDQSAEVLAATEAKIGRLWDLARRAFQPRILQQAVLPLFPNLMGNNEHRLPGSRSGFVDRLNVRLRELADRASVQIVAVDQFVARHGLDAWHDPALWHRSKQEINLMATPLYGDLVVRVLAALSGLSAKCLVLDLDNTIWGGTIGDDGMDGIVLGQGSAAGEAFADVQHYARDLSERGVILAVCSKNDEDVALRAFAEHPEMVLKRSDIASFSANWNDKAANIRNIAAELRIGLDSLVFVDDNPFERSLVRQELPMVAVPEVPEDPALVPACIAAAGYFETVGLTDEDRQRTEQYQTERARAAYAESVTDLESYLRDLQMRLQWRPFDTVGLTRIVQLINKTNQFNLTTRRYTEDEVRAVMDDPLAFGLQFRLVDRLGDNGIIAIVIGRVVDETAHIDTWLMSCRVLGRGVEAATMNVVAAKAEQMGATRVLGEFRPTVKNGMVRDHYDKLGFEPAAAFEDGRTQHLLPLDSFVPSEVAITIEEI